MLNKYKNRATKLLRYINLFLHFLNYFHFLHIVLVAPNCLGFSIKSSQLRAKVAYLQSSAEWDVPCESSVKHNVIRELG